MAVDVNKLMEHVDELYELARLTECRIDAPISELRESLEKNVSRHASKIAGKLRIVTSRGKIEEAIVGGAILGAAWVGASAIDFGRNTYAREMAKAELLSLYEEISVKTQAITLQLVEDNKLLTELLLEEREKNVDNQEKIEELKAKIDRGNEIMRRFEALSA